MNMILLIASDLTPENKSVKTTLMTSLAMSGLVAQVAGGMEHINCAYRAIDQISKHRKDIDLLLVSQHLPLDTTSKECTPEAGLVLCEYVQRNIMPPLPMIILTDDKSISISSLEFDGPTDNIRLLNLSQGKDAFLVTVEQLLTKKPAA